MSLGTEEYMDRVRGALWGIFIADALSMPVHWYYDVEALKRDFGTITDYQAPKEPHPNSYMKLGSNGTGPNINDVIGTVICHGLRDKWTDNAHYHAGLAPGENTLNVRCARIVMDGMTQDGRYDPKTFLDGYVKFMTTPGSHNDPYAETFHRAFFTNYAAGVAPEKCSAGTEGPGTASISGFTMMLPVVLGTLSNPAELKATPKKHLALTHESESLGKTAEAFSELLAAVVAGADLKKSVGAAAKAMGVADLGVVAASGLSDTEVIHKTFGPSCSVDTALPGVLYLAYVHSDSFEDAVLANTNAGGDNGGRGPCLGALMGAALGKAGIPARLIDGLKEKDAIAAQIDAFVDKLCGTCPSV